MPTLMQKKHAQLEQELAQERALNLGLTECLDVANQMLVAAALQAGGTLKLTPADFKASAGRQFARQEVGDDILLSVQDAPAGGQARSALKGSLILS